MHMYSAQEIDFLKNNITGISCKDLTTRFNKHFSLSLSAKKIKSVCSRYKLKNGIKQTFKKGHVPFNKGTKGYMHANKTSFQTGHMPKGHRTVGSERINADGYIEIKTAEPKKWELMHRSIYEKEYGKIPTGYILIFKDGDKSNINLNNLELISRKKGLVLNQNKLISQDPEITESGLLLADVLIKIGDVKKERK